MGDGTNSRKAYLRLRELKNQREVDGMVRSKRVSGPGVEVSNLLTKLKLMIDLRTRNTKTKDDCGGCCAWPGRVYVRFLEMEY
ncbi:hypothetical protein BGX30_007513 [Mortierella sp. GBA39]|nr:hypothetical protein BGX30_007513 [Mortierella sp. GBA39]